MSESEPAPSPARAAAGMGAATAVSRGIGFVRVLAIAAFLGTTYLGNTYQSSSSLSNVLFELLAAGALSAVLVPTFVRMLDAGKHEESERLAGGVLGLALVVMGVVTVIGVLAAPAIARFLTTTVKNPHVAAQQQALSTFFLRFFIPQVLLYVLGAVAVALLFAQRKFKVAAAAPIGNTIFVVGSLVLFRVLNGPNPTLDLSLAEKLVLALGGTLGVAAFVGAPMVALHRTGFHLRPRWPGRDPAVKRLLNLSAWAVFQHSAVGILLLAAIVVGGAVAGGVVAYQTATVFFLAPYAVLAQPVHTAILPEISGEAERGDLAAFNGSMRWTLDSMAMLVMPIAAAMTALALPIMRVAAFGHSANGEGIAVLSAALAGLAPGLFLYSGFLLLARSLYALGDSRTPALVAMTSAIFGVGVMVVAGETVHGAALVAWMGLGNTAAYFVGGIWLTIVLTRRTRHTVLPATLWSVTAVSIVLGLAAWLVSRSIHPTTRIGALILLVAITLVGGPLYLAALRVIRGEPVRLRPRSPNVSA